MTVTAAAEVLGSVRPRIATAGGGRTLGPQVAALLERFELHGRPVDLMHWQRLALNRALRVDEAGGFVHDTVGTIVARGNGKTLLLAARALWGVLARGETVLCIAQNNTTPEREGRCQARAPFLRAA